jgi:hypothetical protein
MLSTSCLKPVLRLDRFVLSQMRTSSLHTTSCLERERAGKYRVTVNRTRPLTYEMAFRPQEIATKKGFNSFNTSQLVSFNYSKKIAIITFLKSSIENNKMYWIGLLEYKFSKYVSKIHKLYELLIKSMSLKFNIAEL